MEFRWRADDGPLKVVFSFDFPPPSSTNKKLSKLDPHWQNVLNPRADEYLLIAINILVTQQAHDTKKRRIDFDVTLIWRCFKVLCLLCIVCSLTCTMTSKQRRINVMTSHRRWSIRRCSKVMWLLRRLYWACSIPSHVVKFLRHICSVVSR